MFSHLDECLRPPSIYTASTSSFWNDEYISERLLTIHLDPNVELASRKLDFIEHSANWIQETITPASHPKLLDIGCGPGIYAEKFARAGYQVTGIDFSKRSIEYARDVAKRRNLSITYIHENYMKMELQGQYDVATLIYCDYGALSTDDRGLLMRKIYDGLTPGGRFLLDVCSIRQYDSFSESRTWEIEEGGFWSADRYLSECKPKVSRLYDAQPIRYYNAK